MPRATARMLDANRLHLQDGPIDLIVEAAGAPDAVNRAYQAASARFAAILDELSGELPLLRSPAYAARPPESVVARRMWQAIRPFASETFITPMAAVAGAVADEMLGTMLSAQLPLRPDGVTRAYVNNGGDIALHLASGQAWRVGLVDRPDCPSLFATTTLHAGDGIGGVATSGWRGRSFSLGIADAVTVLAATAAEADAAATIVANAVDLPGHPAIVRVPATDLQPDNDLGRRLVTRAVGALSQPEIDAALAAGEARAWNLVRRGLIAAAALHLAGTTRFVDKGVRASSMIRELAHA